MVLKFLHLGFDLSDNILIFVVILQNKTTMKQETIKNLHEIGNGEVRELLETEFPEVFKPDFDVEEYLKDLIESVNDIRINHERVDFRKDGAWILDFRKETNKYWMRRYYYDEIRRETGLDHKETSEVCTNALNRLTGWDGCTTYL